jgi:hypothetical protein
MGAPFGRPSLALSDERGQHRPAGVNLALHPTSFEEPDDLLDGGARA